MKRFFWILLFAVAGPFSLSQVENDSLQTVVDSVQISQDIRDAGYANTQLYILGGVDITGNHRFSNNQIIRFSGLRIGDEIEVPGSKLSNAIKRLWKTNQFSNVDLYASRTEGNKIFLRLNLTGLPELNSVEMTGVKKGRKETFIKDNKLTSGTKITDNLKNQVRNSIKDYFVEKGYPDASIKFLEKSVEENDNQINLLINVDRGPRVKIKDIEFSGNKELKSSRLRRKGMKGTNRKSMNIFKSSKLIPEKYEDGLKKIIEEYKSVGFRDAKIVSDTVIRVDENNFLIKIEVNEGRPYFLGDVTFSGNSVFTTEALQRVFAYQKGDRYDAVGINKKISGSEKDDDLMTLYMDNGYLFANLIPVEVNVQNDTIDLEIVIHEGEPATINKVTFTGNTHTHDHVIARELRTKPGDLFSKSDIKRTLYELAGLGYFEPTMIVPDIQPNPENNTVDIDWKLAHKSSSQIELQGGYGGGTFLGTLGLTFGNFSIGNLFNKKAWQPVPTGDGQSLSLRAQAGKGYQNYSISFIEPWIGGKRPTALSLSLYYSMYNYKDIYSERAKLNILGASVGLTKLLTWPDDYFRLSQSVSYQRYDFNNYALTVGNTNYDDGVSNNLNYTIALSRNSAGPNPIFPQNGSDLSVSLSVTPPYSLFNNKNYATMSDVDKFEWLEYYKIKAKAYWYKELFGKLVLRIGGEFGYLGKYKSEIGTIPFERFYIGGTGLTGTRFDGREIIPLRGYQDSTNSGGSSDDITPAGGGSIYDKFLLEFRYPITTGQQATIYGLAFLEAGNTWSDTKEFKPFELKRSAGVGIRIFMAAFGLLGFDFGYGFDENLFSDKASGWQTHFIIGQQF